MGNTIYCDEETGDAPKKLQRLSLESSDEVKYFKEASMELLLAYEKLVGQKEELAEEVREKSSATVKLIQEKERLQKDTKNLTLENTRLLAILIVRGNLDDLELDNVSDISFAV